MAAVAYDSPPSDAPSFAGDSSSAYVSEHVGARMPSFRLTPVRGNSKVVDLGAVAVSIGRGPDNTLPILDEKASR